MLPARQAGDLSLGSTLLWDLRRRADGTYASKTVMAAVTCFVNQATISQPCMPTSGNQKRRGLWAIRPDPRQY